MERATDGMGETTQFINDMWGRATEVVRADGETERYVYDHAGNVIAATDAEGNTETVRPMLTICTTVRSHGLRSMCRCSRKYYSEAHHTQEEQMKRKQAADTSS